MKSFLWHQLHKVATKTESTQRRQQPEQHKQQFHSGLKSLRDAYKQQTENKQLKLTEKPEADCKQVRDYVNTC